MRSIFLLRLVRETSQIKLPSLWTRPHGDQKVDYVNPNVLPHSTLPGPVGTHPTTSLEGFPEMYHQQISTKVFKFLC